MFNSKKDLHKDLLEPYIMKEGMQKNVRFVGETMKQSIPIIHFDGNHIII